MKCGFFGHRNAPPELRSKIKETVIKLIEEKEVAEFYVGNHGNFDTMVLSVLKELSVIYPKINYYVVYAYISAKSGDDIAHIIYPEGIEKASKRYAIVYRNE